MGGVDPWALGDYYTTLQTHNTVDYLPNSSVHLRTYSCTVLQETVSPSLCLSGSKILSWTVSHYRDLILD